ncbi:MAG: hypothetical protein FJ276_32570, partial [Planctomycetes bacterium]|nr:hypothetical protein [Planctomycetota bacterium]
MLSRRTDGQACTKNRKNRIRREREQRREKWLRSLRVESLEPRHLLSTSRMIVQFDDSMSQDAITQWAAEQQATVVHTLSSVFHGAIVDVDQSVGQPSALVAQWLQLPSVLHAEADMVGEYLATVPNDPLFGSLWGLD